jgi:hypothetical protein
MVSFMNFTAPVRNFLDTTTVVWRHTTYDSTRPEENLLFKDVWMRKILTILYYYYYYYSLGLILTRLQHCQHYTLLLWRYTSVVYFTIYNWQSCVLRLCTLFSIIYSECVCSLSYPAGNAHAPYYIDTKQYNTVHAHVNDIWPLVVIIFFHIISQTARLLTKTY